MISTSPFRFQPAGSFFRQQVGIVAVAIMTIRLARCTLDHVFTHFPFFPMPAPHDPEARSQHRALRDAHEHIIEADEILAGLADNLGGRKKSARELLRTIGRLLDEASSPSICVERAQSDERTNRELRAVLHTLDTPADRSAFDINTEVQALITSEDFETDVLTRERLRHLRDILNSQDLD